MASKLPTLLAVDDEQFNLDVIEESLSGCGYELVFARSGEQAWSLLMQRPDTFDAVMLDRQMPGIDGLEVLDRIKEHPALRALPVILQTAADAPEHVAEGLAAGAFYYLTKPIVPGVLRAVVATAVRGRSQQLLGLQETEDQHQALHQLEEARFSFRTPAEARRVACLVSWLCPRRQSAYIGLTELMLNAVEHGNLAISYDETTQLHEGEKFFAEVERRLRLPEYMERYATLSFRRQGVRLVFTISDMGNGFDWRPYLEMRADRISHNHGRGIAMARSIAFDRLEYQGAGSVVEASILCSVPQAAIGR